MRQEDADWPEPKGWDYYGVNEMIERENLAKQD
jgi:hypothetical protein